MANLEKVTVPIVWLAGTIPFIAGAMMWLTTVASDVKANTKENEQQSVEIKAMQREIQWAAEDAAWLRGRIDSNFEEVQKKRRIEELVDK